MQNDTAAQSEEQKNGSLLEQARQLFERADLAGSFLLSKEHWLSNPNDISAVQLLSEIMRKNGKKDLHKHLRTLSASQEILLSDTQCLFEAAYQFIEEREPELAVMLLERCVQLEPEQTVLRYELGFALMQLRRFDDAITEFEKLLLEDGEDFDTRLNLTVCHSLTRNLDRAKTLVKELERLACNQEEKNELALRNWVIRRLEKFEPKQKLEIRDWVYSLYGSVLLSETTPKDLNGRARGIAADYPGVASTLVVLHGLLRELGLEFHVIEYYSPLSRPLAEALARMMDISAEVYRGPERKETALLVMAWASDIIGPHKAFVPHNPRRTIFAYGLTTLASLPVTPDIIGCLASECAMPWSKLLEDLEPDDEIRDAGTVHPMNKIQEEAMNAILSTFTDLESNPQIIKQVEELHKYYTSRKEFLVLDNAKSFPERPEYTAEIPLA